MILFRNTFESTVQLAVESAFILLVVFETCHVSGPGEPCFISEDEGLRV